MPPEVENGNIEYKRKLSSEPSRLKTLITQLISRLDEGNGLAIYYIGLDDDGSYYGITTMEFSISCSVLKMMCDKTDSHIIENKIITFKNKTIYKVTIIINNVIRDEQRILIMGMNNDKFVSQLLYDNENCVNRIYNYEHEQKYGIQSLNIKHFGMNFQTKKILNMKNCMNIYNLKEKSTHIYTIYMAPNLSQITSLVKYVNSILIINDINLNKNIDICEKLNMKYEIVNDYTKAKFNFKNIDNIFCDGILILNIIKQTNGNYLVTLLNGNNTTVKNKSKFYGFNHINDSICIINIESIMYFNKYIEIIDKPITFTAIISSKNDIRKFKRQKLFKI